MIDTARAIQNGVDKDSASRLLSIIGITNTIGRVICGWVADHPKVACLSGSVSFIINYLLLYSITNVLLLDVAVVQVNVLLLNNISLTVCGAVTILSPLFQSYEMLIVYSCLFGISIGW